MGNSSRDPSFKHGDWNICVAAFGVPGTGKSEWALRYCVELSQEHTCYVLAHDPGFRIRSKFHDGTPTGVMRHDSIDSVKAQLAKDPRGVHAINVPDASEVLQFAKELAEQSLKQHPYRDGRPTRGVPVLVYIDEAVSAADANPRMLGDLMRQCITGRRHWHVGIVYTCQSPWMVHYALISMSTEVVIFRVKTKRDFNRLEESGIDWAESSEWRKKIKHLPNYQYEVYELDREAVKKLTKRRNRQPREVDET